MMHILLRVLLVSSFLFSIHSKIDQLQEESKFQEALKLCEDNYNDNDVELLWRFARAYFDIADQTSNVDIKKNNIDKALPHSKRALEIDPNSARANHWYAVIIGQKGLLEGTKQKILNSYEVREYGLKAIKLDPKYDGTHHLMGRWHYNVADLAWYERTIATAIYATPPEGSFEKAIEYFGNAIETNPNDLRHYLWMAKSLYQIREYEKAKSILDEASTIEVKNQSDKIIVNQIKELYSKL